MSLRVHFGLTDGQRMIEYFRKIVWDGSAPGNWVRPNEGYGQWMPRDRESATVQLSAEAMSAQAGDKDGSSSRGNQAPAAPETQRTSSIAASFRSMSPQQVRTQMAITLLQGAPQGPSQAALELLQPEVNEGGTGSRPPQPATSHTLREMSEDQEAVRRERAEEEPVEPVAPLVNRPPLQVVGWISGAFSGRRPG